MLWSSVLTLELLLAPTALLAVPVIHMEKKFAQRNENIFKNIQQMTFLEFEQTQPDARPRLRLLKRNDQESFCGLLLSAT